MFQISVWKELWNASRISNSLQGLRQLALQNPTERPWSRSLPGPNFREALYKAIVEPSKLPGANERSAGVGLAFVKLFHRRPNGSGGGLQITSSQQPAVNIQQQWMTEVGSIPTPGSSIQTCRAITRTGNCREHHPFRVSRLRPGTNLKCYRVGY